MGSENTRVMTRDEMDIALDEYAQKAGLNEPKYVLNLDNIVDDEESQ